MITDRKMRREALEMLDTMRAVLGDVLASAVELGHVVGPLNGALTDALGCAVRQATGLSVLVKETLKEALHETEEELEAGRGTGDQGPLAVDGEAARDGDEGDDSEAHGGAGCSGQRQ